MPPPTLPAPRVLAGDLCLLWECVLALGPPLACVFQASWPPRGAAPLLVVLGTDPWLRTSDASQTHGRPPVFSGGGGLPSTKQPLQFPRWMKVLDFGVSTADGGVKGSRLGSSAVKPPGAGDPGQLALPRCPFLSAAPQRLCKPCREPCAGRPGPECSACSKCLIIMMNWEGGLQVVREPAVGRAVEAAGLGPQAQGGRQPL